MSDLVSKESQSLFNRIYSKAPDLREMNRMLEGAEHEQAMNDLRFDAKYAAYRKKMIEKYGHDVVTNLEKEAVNGG